MKKFRTLTLITTVMDILACIFSFSALLVLLDYTGLLKTGLSKIVSFITNVDPESVVAGYQVIGGLFGMLSGGLIMVVLLLAELVSAALAFLMIAPSISGVICLKKLKDEAVNDIKWIRIDSIVKLIANCIPALFLIYMMLFEDIVMVLPTLYFGSACGISIYLLRNLNKTE